jgi:hypothetical protein
VSKYGTLQVKLYLQQGQDKSAVITKLFCKECHGAIILSDITRSGNLKEYVYKINSAL